MSYAIKKYNIIPGNRERWIIVGKTREYFLTEFSCSCKSFQLIISRREKEICKHIKTVREAIKSGKYDSYDISIPEYQNIRDYLINNKK